MEIKNTLKKLGLNNREIEVYLELLKSGRSQAGPVVKATALHRMQVYEAFEELKNKGLVMVSQEKNIQFFEAANPKILVELSQTQLDLAKMASEELQKRMTSQGHLEIKQLVGSEGLFNNLAASIHSASLSKDKTMRMIGGGSDSYFYHALGNYYNSYATLLQQYKVKKRLLGPEKETTVTSARFKNEYDSEARILPPSFNHPVYTRITHDIVSMEFYVPEATIIQITNSDLAASYIANFDMIWDSAQTLK